jgi:hypothetical protein
MATRAPTPDAKLSTLTPRQVQAALQLANVDAGDSETI